MFYVMCDSMKSKNYVAKASKPIMLAIHKGFIYLCMYSKIAIEYICGQDI